VPRGTSDYLSTSGGFRIVSDALGCCHSSLQNQEGILVLQKRIYQIQTDLGTTQTQFGETNEKLDVTNKSLTAVSVNLVNSLIFRCAASSNCAEIAV